MLGEAWAFWHSRTQYRRVYVPALGKSAVGSSGYVFFYSVHSLSDSYWMGAHAIETRESRRDARTYRVATGKLRRASCLLDQPCGQPFCHFATTSRIKTFVPSIELFVALLCRTAPVSLLTFAPPLIFDLVSGYGRLFAHFRPDLGLSETVSDSPWRGMTEVTYRHATGNVERFASGLGQSSRHCLGQFVAIRAGRLSVKVAMILGGPFSVGT